MSISGKYASVEIGGSTIALVSQWDADEEVQSLGRTCGSDNGYRNVDAGIASLDVSIKGYMDIATGDYAAIEAGTVLSNLKLFRDASDSEPAYLLPSALVTKSHQGAMVEGKVEFTATIQNKGSYTYTDP